jgi:hypothetical protein
MKDTMHSEEHGSTKAAVEALARGFIPVPIRDGGKRPYGAAWQRTSWESEEQVREAFDRYAIEGATGVGLVLGEPSGGLIDIDLDHPKALRLRDHFLPPSPMQTGRAGRPKSHRWYLVKDALPGTRRYKMPDGSVSVELRSTGAQTIIPPSTWWPKDASAGSRTEKYRWEGQPWGGKRGPAVIEGRKLAIQVAALGMGTVLLDGWPKSGGRHDAYLALAGGLLRFGDGVHPFWEKFLPVVIDALADATHDDDGGESRIAETMGTTLTKLREGGKATGFPRLAEMIGAEHAEMVRRMAKEVESLSGFAGQPIQRLMTDTGEMVTVETPTLFDDEPLSTMLPPEKRNPMEERISSWAAVDLEPYIAGEVTMPEPTVLVRTDGQGLIYPGRVNSVFGLSESAKSWICLFAEVQEMDKAERAIYIDFEDEPVGTLTRLRALGAADDDIKNQMRYVHPEGPLADMQRYRFGSQPTDDGKGNAAVFRALLESFDPTIIVVDGMTVLYGLHGHDTNEATATDVITQWLKSLTRSGRTTVIVIDHTGKGAGPGASPIGAHHKVAMVQGTALRVDVVDRPMPGAVGRMRLIVYKDRPGSVRQISTKTTGEQVCGEVVMDSTIPGVTKMTIEPPDPADFVVGNSEGSDRMLAKLAESEELQGRIVDLFGGEVGKTLVTSDVVAALEVSAEQVYDAWSMLKATGVVVQEGERRWTKYRLNENALPDSEEND